jgi:hypothetical protein
MAEQLTLHCRWFSPRWPMLRREKNNETSKAAVDVLTKMLYLIQI